MTRNYWESTRNFEPPYCPLHSPGSSTTRLPCPFKGSNRRVLYHPTPYPFKGSNRLPGKGPRGRFLTNCLRRLSSQNCNQMTSMDSGTGYSRIELEESYAVMGLTSLGSPRFSFIPRISSIRICLERLRVTQHWFPQFSVGTNFGSLVLTFK